jgi:hypothetical protein
MAESCAVFKIFKIVPAQNGLLKKGTSAIFIIMAQLLPPGFVQGWQFQGPTEH